MMTLLPRVHAEYYVSECHPFLLFCNWNERAKRASFHMDIDVYSRRIMRQFLRTHFSSRKRKCDLIN